MGKRRRRRDLNKSDEIWLIYDLMFSALHIEDCHDDILTAQISFETGRRYSFMGSIEYFGKHV